MNDTVDGGAYVVGARITSPIDDALIPPHQWVHDKALPDGVGGRDPIPRLPRLSFSL